MISRISQEIRGNEICILGFGREGRSVLHFLRNHFPDHSLTVADRNPVTIDDPAVTIFSGEHYLDALATADTIVRSPGIRMTLPAIQEACARGAKLTSATNIFFAAAPGTTVGITGTKGKSSTSALLAHILQTDSRDVRLVGNIGNPALDRLAGADKQTIFVTECSSFQLDDFHYAPSIAIVLNIVAEHLDYHGSFANYVQAKSNLVRSMSQESILIYNPSFPTLAGLASTSKARTIPFGLPTSVAYIDKQQIFLRSEGQHIALLSRESVPLLGPGNDQNIMAAISAASTLGVSPQTIRAALPTFVGLQHRLQTIACVRGVTFVDDSISTIPEATINALQAFHPRVYTLIVGGYDRGLEYQALAEALRESSVQLLLLFPDTGEKILHACFSAGVDVQYQHVTSMEQAVGYALELTPDEHICLLSPASSSFNLFRDYHDRGEQFARAIAAHSLTEK